MHVARRLTTLVQLAMALVTDLGLSAEPPVSLESTDISLRAYPEDIPNLSIAQRTLEERRAFLGLTYLRSASVIFCLIPHPCS